MISIVVLSYNRKDFLKQSIDSIHKTTKEPYELIVVDDGSEKDVVDFLIDLHNKKQISSLVLNSGRNMGVGESVRKGFAIAHGSYLVKSDQDLIYKEGWDTKCVDILHFNQDKVEMVGCFKYEAGHPTVDFNKTNPVKKNKYYLVDDFVSSMFMIRKEFYKKFGEFPVGSEAFAEDVEYKTKMKESGYKLALTLEDYIYNQGFGLGKSTLFTEDSTEEKLKVVNINKKPLTFNDGGENVKK